jgi:tetratricopeptide (TPR) repeat protein
MKQLLFILSLCVATTSNSQKLDEVDYFFSVKSYSDSSLRYYLTILENFDPTDKYGNFLCDKASEKVGDIFKSRKDYSRALKYYDSADTKYKDELELCGNAYYIDFIPRQYKKSQCYLELKNIKQAVKVLTPHIFDDFAASYFDTSMTTYYSTILSLLYSKQEIQIELKRSIDSINYKTSFVWSLDSSSKYLYVSCKLKIFDSELELAGFQTSTIKDNEVPYHATKDYFVRQTQGLTIYKRLQH